MWSQREGTPVTAPRDTEVSQIQRMQDKCDSQTERDKAQRFWMLQLKSVPELKTESWVLVMKEVKSVA